MTTRRKSVPAKLLFPHVLKAEGLPEATLELQFAKPRKWRADFSWPDNGKVILEVEGGVFTQGRHTRGAGFLADVEKYNRATVLGWKVLRCTPDTLCSKETIAMLREALA